MKHRERWIPVTLGLGLLVLASGAWLSWPVVRHAFDSGRQFRPYSIPSESMCPTLEPGDRVYARSLEAGGARRGDVVVVRLGSDIRVARVAGLAGDRIGLSDGIVELNGKAIPQVPGWVAGNAYGEARRLIEQFPGEGQPHAILDTGPTPQDNVAGLVVPAGHVFLLGDNRDNSADSRTPRESYGLAMVPVKNIIGRVDFIAWSTRLSGRFDRPITKLEP